jgi:hypothetical protein
MQKSRKKNFEGLIVSENDFSFEVNLELLDL